jgi:Glycerophosphoryl diester phosphodiesterase
MEEDLPHEELLLMAIRSLSIFGLVLLGIVQLSALAFAQKPPLILAHRGGMEEFEENTLGAFRSSYEKGIRGFEVDIRMTNDGVLVILHDDTLDRTHDGTGSVELKTANELRSLKTKKFGESFLFLDEFLDYFHDKPGVYIELEMKTGKRDHYPDERIEEYCQKLHTAASAKKHPDSTYVFSSFDDRPLRVLRKMDASAPLSLIVSRPCSKELIDRAKEVGADRIACQLAGSSRNAVREAQKAGLMVNGWPGRSVQDYLLARGLGVDIHCTDFPIQMLSVQERLK